MVNAHLYFGKFQDSKTREERKKYAPRVTGKGVFDFDNAVFADDWKRISDRLSGTRAVSLSNRHVRHNVSDHRPIWVDLATG